RRVTTSPVGPEAVSKSETFTSPETGIQSTPSPSLDIRHRPKPPALTEPKASTGSERAPMEEIIKAAAARMRETARHEKPATAISDRPFSQPGGASNVDVLNAFGNPNFTSRGFSKDRQTLH